MYSEPGLMQSVRPIMPRALALVHVAVQAEQRLAFVMKSRTAVDPTEPIGARRRRLHRAVGVEHGGLVELRAAGRRVEHRDEVVRGR